MNIWKQVSDERYQIIMERSAQFRRALDDENLTPVKVFDPLAPERLQELELIRDASKFLQKKKDEDISKAQAASQEPEKEPEEAKEVEKEDS